MKKAPGEGFDPARKIVDIAQANLSMDEFLEKLLGTLDRSLGFDSAVAVRGDVPSVVVYNFNEQQNKLIRQSLRFANTKYFDDLNRVFSYTAEVGACLDSDFYTSDRERWDSIYYREILNPAGVRSLIHICARWRGRPVLRLNLNRSGRQPFRHSDLDAVMRLLPTLEASVAARILEEPTRDIPGLTRREREIADLVAKGLTTSQIGMVLGTSPYTVRNQLTRIYEKLQIESRAELAAHVARVRSSAELPKGGSIVNGAGYANLSRRMGKKEKNEERRREEGERAKEAKLVRSEQVVMGDGQLGEASVERGPERRNPEGTALTPNPRPEDR